MTTTAAVGITGIDATYYRTKDLIGSTAFYTKFFGAEPTMHIPNTVSEWTFGGGEAFGLYQPPEAGDWRPGGGLLFHVKDFRGAVEAAKALGATFDERQEETPMCYMAFGTDPEGNTFILHKPKE
ncbi:MAG TPA: VOC family protein [Verrucomicrobiae bacterium]|nr:VOC family protein [Verrucomicrobiae bacterium]